MMIPLSNKTGHARPSFRNFVTAVFIAAATLAGAPGAPPALAAAPDEVRIPLAGFDAHDDAAVERLRGRIAAAARALCDSGGVAGLYRDSARRCRARATADAERQLGARRAPRLASSTR